VVDSSGQPQVGVVIYLYLQESSDSGEVSEEFGAVSVVTDENGFYSFDNLPIGNYRVSPNLTGFEFVPASVTVSEGSSAPVVEAVPLQTQENGCEKVNMVDIIVTADVRARTLLETIIEIGERGLNIGKNLQLAIKQEEAFRRSLIRTLILPRRHYTELLNISELLPKNVLSCAAASQCTPLSFRKEIRRYRKILHHIRKTGFFLIKKFRRVFGKDSQVLIVGSSVRIRRQHAQALKSTRLLPKRSFNCP
jgi:hypothetical protein